MRELIQHVRPNQFSKIMDVHLSHKPNYLWGAFSGDLWRHKSMGKTLDHITDDLKFDELQSHATNNLKLWEREKVAPPQKVEVVHQDFGDTAFEMTKKHGKAYPILNMANSLFPGGAALEGGCAQEESLWHRSSCARSLLSKGIYYDVKSRCFLYDAKGQKLLSAQEKMTPEELQALSILREKTIPEAYKVYMPDQPQVYFRRPEILLPTSIEESSSRNQFIADSALSYTFLPKEKIFPFYEIRSAAPELVGKEIDLEDKEALREYTQDLGRRIGAQLDTLILKGKTDAILGAWGCGSFKNDPEVVAKVYREEIEKRAKHFQHLVFPIIDVENVSNYNAFKKHLDGLELGNLASKAHLKTRTPIVSSPYSLYAQKPVSTSNAESKDPASCIII